MKERKFIVSYDISDPNRLRRVVKIVEGYGYRLQYSVFICPITELQLERLKNNLLGVINRDEDQCVFIDMGISDEISDTMTSIGKPLLKIPKITII